MFIITELLYLNSFALRRLLGFLRNFASGTETVTITVLYSLDLLKTIREPHDVETTARQNGMNRIVNLNKALEKVKLINKIVIQVTDAFLSQNSGKWKVAPGEKVNIVKKYGGEADIQVNITGLTQLLTGFADIRELEIAGAADIYTKDEKIYDTFPLKNLFISEHDHC